VEYSSEIKWGKTGGMAQAKLETDVVLTKALLLME